MTCFAPHAYARAQKHAHAATELEEVSPEKVSELTEGWNDFQKEKKLTDKPLLALVQKYLPRESLGLGDCAIQHNDYFLAHKRKTLIGSLEENREDAEVTPKRLADLPKQVRALGGFAIHDLKLRNGKVRIRKARIEDNCGMCPN